MPLPPLGEAQVYFVNLAQHATGEYLPVLSPHEHERAERYRVERARTQFIVTRGVLRKLLGRYLDCDPGQIGFQYARAGKPSLENAEFNLQFSVSHSGELAALVFARDCEVGIDIEHVRPMPEMQAIARSQFSRDECAQLFSAPEQNREKLFFRFWTRKEALAKATGVGIAAESADASHWFRYDLDPGPGSVGTLCVGRAVHVKNISMT